MEALRIIEARSQVDGVFRLLTGVVAALAAVGLAVYVARQFRANAAHEAIKGAAGQQGD
jgi:high-affinity Fe2+/Pb2+ permease